MTKPNGHAPDQFLHELKVAVRKALKDPDATPRDKNAAIANGIKLAMIEHRIKPDEEGSYFDGGK
jgi:hypothetical protein